MTQEEMLHRFAAVVERLESQTRIIAEGHGLLVGKFDEVFERLDRLEAGQLRHDAEIAALRLELRSFKDEIHARFDAHDKRFDAHDKRFDAIEDRLKAHDQRFDAHDARFDAQDARLTAIAERQERFEAKVMAEFAELKAMIKFSFAELDRRITTLEHVVQDLLGRVERLESRAL